MRQNLNTRNTWYFAVISVDVRVFGASKYGPGFGTINYSNVKCTGEETNISQCLSTVLPTDCDHSEDAAVMCQICKWV